MEPPSANRWAKRNPRPRRTGGNGKAGFHFRRALEVRQIRRGSALGVERALAPRHLTRGVSDRRVVAESPGSWVGAAEVATQEAHDEIMKQIKAISSSRSAPRRSRNAAPQQFAQGAWACSPFSYCLKPLRAHLS